MRRDRKSESGEGFMRRYHANLSRASRVVTGLTSPCAASGTEAVSVLES